jgi:hypothetical protein
MSGQPVRRGGGSGWLIAIIVVAVFGIVAVGYMAYKSGIPDCSQQDGTTDHVSVYKLDKDSNTCVPDKCESGYALTSDGSCVISDCSKIDGSNVHVKSYIFDKKLGCVPADCTDGSKPKDGACPAPPNVRPPSSITTTPNNEAAVPNFMPSLSGVYGVYFGPDGNGTLAAVWDTKGNRLWSWGNGPNVKADTSVKLKSDGTVQVYRTSDGYSLGIFGNKGPVDGSHAYNLIMQDDGNLVVYPIVNGVWDSKALWASR